MKCPKNLSIGGYKCPNIGVNLSNGGYDRLMHDVILPFVMYE
ncbi:MAG: hypothetical protein WCJ61_17065 [Paludibacter sp.]